jgi:hypothetical protein
MPEPLGPKLERSKELLDAKVVCRAHLQEEQACHKDADANKHKQEHAY